jgi:hypothetical protein
MYADVKEIRPCAALKLQSRLRQAASRAMQLRLHLIISELTGATGNHPMPPQQAHLSPTSRSQYHYSTNNISDTVAARPEVGSHNSATSGPKTSNLMGDIRALQYILLCVNTKRLIVLEHIDVTGLKNDQYVFKEIRAVYKLIRERHEWNLSQLFPGPLWIPKWLLRYIKNTSILIPTSADLVRVRHPYSLSKSSN